MTHDSELKGSDVRLWGLIAQRSRPGADKAAIDERIWDLFGEEWTVMMTDLSGFSRQVAAFGIIHFLQVIHEQKQLLLPIVANHDGILIKVEADSFLILFKRPVKALACAVDMQRACAKHNLHKAPEEQILLCLGIGHGRVLRIGDADVFGAEVNAASKLGEDTAKTGEILITAAMQQVVAQVPGLRFEDLEATVPGSQRNFRVHYDRV